MSLFVTSRHHLPKRPQSPPGGGCQIFDLRTLWVAVALMVVNLSCASVPENANSAGQSPAAAESPATSDMQAKAAAALASTDMTNVDAANTMATNGMAANEPVSAGEAPRAEAPAVASTDARDANEVLTNGMDVLDDTYKLAVGDSITFQIVEDNNDPQSLSVEDSGDIVIPYLGRYPAEGKTCKQLAIELKKRLEKKYYYQATVIISVDTKITHGVVYVIGGVKVPGPMEMPKDEVLTVSKAILRAGGFDDFADEKHVRVTRQTDAGTNEVLMVNVKDVLDEGDTAKDIKVEPGDLIYIQEKTVRF
jgi:polysaccharide export outer membrane protein